MTRRMSLVGLVVALIALACLLAAVASAGRRTRAPPPDNDNDGMPNAWEIGHNLDPANAADSSTDADSDGHTNIEEYLNGSDPRAADGP